MHFPLPYYPNSSLTLHNLLLLPHITKNLISVGKFAQDNHVVEFHPQFCLVKSQASSEVLLRGTVGADGLYKLANPISHLSTSLPSHSTTSAICNFSSTCNPVMNPVANCNCISLCNYGFHNNTHDSACQFPPSAYVHTVNIPNSYQNVNIPNSISNNKYVLWHTRLGHTHHRALAEVLKLCNIPIPPKPPTDLCSAYCLGKYQTSYFLVYHCVSPTI